MAESSTAGLFKVVRQSLTLWQWLDYVVFFAVAGIPVYCCCACFLWCVCRRWCHRRREKREKQRKNRKRQQEETRHGGHHGQEERQHHGTYHGKHHGKGSGKTTTTSREKAGCEKTTRDRPEAGSSRGHGEHRKTRRNPEGPGVQMSSHHDEHHSRGHAKSRYQTAESSPADGGRSARKKPLALPPGFEELVDSRTGDVYWVNSQTGETTWKHPSWLPPGWEEVVDGRTGDKYFFHTPTGKSSWSRPDK